MNSFVRLGSRHLNKNKHDKTQHHRNIKINKLMQPSIIASALMLAFSLQNTAAASETAASDTLAAESKMENKEIERIEVVGQINTGLMESEIALADTSSPDLRSQLSQIPGVSVNGNGLVSGIVQYRGLFGDRLNLKIDGIQIAGAGPNGMDSPLSHAMGNKQQVVLYQGVTPVSVAYETLGGALQIRDSKPMLRETESYETSGQVSGSWFANNEAQMLGVNLLTSNDQSYFSIQGQYQDAENYEDGEGHTVPSTFYNRSGLKISAGKHTDDYELDFLLGSRNTNESGTPALAMDITFVDSLWYKLRFAKDIGESWRANIKVFGNQNEHVMNNFELRTAPMLAGFRENTVDSEALGADIDLVQSTNDINLWKLGANLYSQRHNSTITNPNNASFFINNFNNIQRDVLSVYAEYDIAAKVSQLQQNDDVHWQLGGRFTNVTYAADDVASNMAMMNPNVASLVMGFNQDDRSLNFDLLDLVVKAQTNINDSLQATLSFGQKERAPSYNEVYSWFPLGVSAGLADGRNYIGNLELQKETAAQFDLGLQLQHDGLTVMGNLFFHNIDNYIIGVPSSSMPANMIAMMMGTQQPLQWNNRAAKLHGADLYVSQLFGTHWQATLSAQWVDGKLSEAIDGERYPLYRVSPLSGNLTLQWRNDDIEASLALNVASAQNEVSALQNETPTAGYGVWNASVRYQLSSKFSVSIVAENLLDKTYAQHLGGINRVSGSDIQVAQKVPEIGRNIGLYAEYSF
jgi:iron complex outermembrane receptor protein